MQLIVYKINQGKTINCLQGEPREKN